jgi:SH3-like domain-containing protein
MSRRGVAAALLALAFGPRALADESSEGLPADAAVAVVTGDGVNLRVGPRVDDAPVTQLEQGTVVVIVERPGDWRGVRVPAGFQAAIAAVLTEVEDAEHVRVAASRVNLRVKPPTAERAYPAFADRPAKGTVLPVIDREGDWLWVEAPESVRAYVHSKFLKELGPLAEHRDRVEKARDVRTAREVTRLAAKAKSRSEGDDALLRAAIGAATEGLAKARAAGGSDKAPVVALADRLESEREARPNASASTKALAKALSEDLEKEIELRVAFADEALARARTGRPAPPPKPPAPRVESLTASGTIRWEPAPGWENGGAFVLWSGEKPVYALVWAVGDIEPFADSTTVGVKGKAPGTTLLGLPVLDVETISRPAR